jgi:hypothetical protein
MSADGRLIKNRYKIGKKYFAKGGFGKVYLAEDIQLSMQLIKLNISKI